VGTYGSFHSPYLVKEGITGNCTPSSKIKGPVKDFAQAKKIRKTLISTVLQLLYDVLSWKTDVNVPLKSNNQKYVEKLILLAS
jgi:hypothetical protein